MDGLFNLTYFATGLFTVKVAGLVARGDDERFPHGYAFFEPLVNGLKGVLVLGVSVMALLGAVGALWSGGRSIAAGAAVAYGAFASLTCWGVALVTRYGAKRTGSPLVSADAENWIVNAAISSCVLLAFGGIFVLQAAGLDAFVPYVDPVVVVAVVGFSLGVPVRMAWQALMELLNRAPEENVVRRVTELVDQHLTDLPVSERFVRVIQPGRTRLVLVHVVLQEEFRPDGLKPLDDIRLRTQESLRHAHEGAVLDMLFTHDRRWGAPLSEVGSI